MHHPLYKNRLLPTAISAACLWQGIDCYDFSDGWVLQLEKDDQQHRICGHTFDLNTAAAAEIANDKVATFHLLSANSIPAVPHMLVRSTESKRLDTSTLRRHFSSQEALVLKPLSGHGGRGVTKLESINSAIAHIQKSTELAWAASPLLDIQSEIRVIMLDQEPILVFEKTHPSIENGLKLFNLHKGAQAQIIISPDKALLKLAITGTRALNLRLAAVDIIRTADNGLLVLEVNQSITLEYFARQSEQHKRAALEVYRKIVERMFE